MAVHAPRAWPGQEPNVNKLAADQFAAKVPRPPPLCREQATACNS
jgi:hypothetical protein